MKITKTVRYSEGFKLQVIREYESGRFESMNAVQQHYGIRGGGTLQIWLRKFGKNALLPKVVRVEKPDEQNELKRLKQRVRKLEEALADKHLDHELEKSYLEIACEWAGIKDVDQFKKKHAGTPRIRPPNGRGSKES